MNLPELSPRATPRFVDAESCRAWLQDVPLANIAVAQQDMLAELETFNRFPTSTANRLAVIEALREPLGFVQMEHAKRFMNRALPMAQAEAAAFEDTVELWEQMRLGYLRCLLAAVGGDTLMRAQAALLAQRLAAYSGLKMFHYYRAYREVPREDWRSLHEVYAHAERLGVAEEEAKDPLNRDVHDSSPRIAYVRALLMGMASPHELGQRQLTFVAFLLERWAAKVLLTRGPSDADGVPPLAVDLAGERLPERLAAGAAAPADPRYLDTRQLSKSLRNRVALLRKGESPATLGLGDDCVQPSCEQTLVFLYRQWCQPKPARHVAGRGAMASAQVTNDIEAIHHYLSGGRRRQVEAKDLTQQMRLELETLGRVRGLDNEQYTSARGYALEDWAIEEDSAQELQVVRAAAAQGTKRYTHGQLVAVRPAGTSGFILGQVRWLIDGVNGDLRAGVKLMPGIATATSVRGTGLNDKTERPTCALSLAAVPALKSPPALVLPAGWYKPRRVLELGGEKPCNVRLIEVLERGADFERVAYEAA